MNNYDNLFFFIMLFFGLFAFIGAVIWTIYDLEKEDKTRKKFSKITKNFKKA